MNIKLHYRKIIGVVLGALSGYAYYHYVGCLSGHCPISSNPWISTGYGALLGYLIAPSKSKSVEPAHSDEEKE
jgi:hypothetical protein